MSKKSNFNVPTYKNVIDEFDKWAENVAGHKGDKVAGALRAIQALYVIDTNVTLQLMQPNITIKEAIALITEAIVERESHNFVASLTPEQRRKVLLDAKAYRDKVSRKKKVP